MQRSGLAVISLVFGMLCWSVLPLMGNWFWLLGAILAVITGHLARHDIKRSNGYIVGKGLTTAGLWLGYSAVIVTALITLGALGTIGYIADHEAGQ